MAACRVESEWFHCAPEEGFPAIGMNVAGRKDRQVWPAFRASDELCGLPYLPTVTALATPSRHGMAWHGERGRPVGVHLLPDASLIPHFARSCRVGKAAGMESMIARSLLSKQTDCSTSETSSIIPTSSALASLRIEVRLALRSPRSSSEVREWCSRPAAAYTSWVIPAEVQERRAIDLKRIPPSTLREVYDRRTNFGGTS